ncbi:MAG TPA: diguanylate cyclase [Gaiellaceae bacterium]
MVTQSAAAAPPGPGPDASSGSDTLVESYRRLAEVFHEVLSEQSLDALLERIAVTLGDLMPFEALHVYEADEARRVLVPLHAHSQAYEEEIMRSRPRFGEGITGWAVENRQPVWTNRAHLDPRSVNVPGTPVEPEAMISIPLIARGALKGALNIYRIGEDAEFAEHEFRLAKSFADAAALALDNAQIRARLEHLAQTDPLTGLYNHRYFHERLRSELTRASRSHDSVAVLMFDLDDFKRVNDVYGHGAGDQLLIQIARIARETVRGSDVVCRIGGEEFGVIMPSCDAGDALGLAARLSETLRGTDFEPSGRITVSMGVAQGPEHAMNPRELVACAEAAMMTAKARGKDQSVIYDDGPAERPAAAVVAGRDVRSIAHLKMLQSLAGKLNRLNDVAEIGRTIATELRLLIDYHNCRVVLRHGDELRPIAFVGDYDDSVGDATSVYTQRVGVGVTGRAVETGDALLIPNALECEFAWRIPGTTDLEESLAAVPLRYGARVTGAIVISKLGVNQFDEDDVRLLEVLAGQASVALENARLYEQQRREAEGAKALLAFADDVSRAQSVEDICALAVRGATRLFEAERASLWLGEECVASVGEPLADGTTAPLVEEDGVTGRVVVDLPQLDDDRQRLFASYAYQLSVALQKARLYGKQLEAAEIANALLEAGRELATAESPDEVLRRIVEVTARVLNVPRTTLWIQEEAEPQDLVARASYGYAPDRDPAPCRRFTAAVAQQWLARPEPFVLERDEAARIEGVDPERANRFVVAPLRLEGGRVGALVSTVEDRPIDGRQLRLVTGLAHQVKLAIESAENYEGLERTFVATVAALANALEANDEYTSSHARWITDMALLVGRELRLDRAAMKRLELGALFHDIGKIGIPSQILRKPGPLTDEEFRIVKQHPELGEKILAPIDRLHDVLPVVRACHERWDGGGYPDGKAGEEIPVEARIVLVCDAFHAMVTDRPYRERLPVAEAVRRLEEGAGTQFDPTIVATFSRLVAAGAVPAAA